MDKRKPSVEATRGRKPLAAAKAKDVRERLRRVLREYYGGVQAKFARAAGLPPNTVSGWLGGSPRTPETAHLVQIAENTGVSIDWLLRGDGPMLFVVPRESAPEQLRAILITQLLATGEGDATALDAAMPSADETMQVVVEVLRPILKGRMIGRRRPHEFYRDLAEWNARALEAHPEWRNLRGGAMEGYERDGVGEPPPLKWRIEHR